MCAGRADARSSTILRKFAVWRKLHRLPHFELHSGLSIRAGKTAYAQNLASCPLNLLPCPKGIFDLGSSFWNYFRIRKPQKIAASAFGISPGNYVT